MTGPTGNPGIRGLHDPGVERSACGVGFVADVKGRRSHGVVASALKILENLSHRGATGCDPLTGDGCGILLQIPHAFLASRADLSFRLPEPGSYALGQAFLPRDSAACASRRALVEEALRSEGLPLLGWRFVPVETEHTGPIAREGMPHILQFFVGRGTCADETAFERRLYVARKVIERRAREAAARDDQKMYVCSLSIRTVVYKGLLLPENLDRFYVDLADPSVRTAIAVVHQRFSTNTFPSWERAHPYRLIAHNGEINTLRGNQSWMAARERVFAARPFGIDAEKLVPVIDEGGSDSSMFDNTLEMLVQSGRSLPHAMTMMIPEAWENHREMTPEKRAFYEYHASLMEPWDGPALICFSDGRLVGACLDRNGLRPARFTVTDDDQVILASEAGVIDLPPERVQRHDRLRPGRMLVIDTEQGRIVSDDELKQTLATRRPYRRWVDQHLVRASELPEPAALPAPLDEDALATAQRVHGYTGEDLRMLLAPMANDGKEPIGAMGDDAALAVLSERPQLLFHYFKQLFAQVTNPPIDPIREALVMSLRSTLGPEPDLFSELPHACHQLELAGPVLTPHELEQIRALNRGALWAGTLEALFPARPGGLREGIERLKEEATAVARDGRVTLLILSDRGHDAERAPIPSLLAVAAVHHHLIREGLRHRVGLIVESGEVREVMHLCLLLGYGAAAVCPYLALETVDALGRDAFVEVDRESARDNLVEAFHQGVLKVMSKMGISTLQGYRGAQVFEAVGLGAEVIDAFFPGTASRIDGIGLDVIERECLLRQADAHERLPGVEADLEWGGRYKWRRDGEPHALSPNVVGMLQHAVRSASYDVFRKYTRLVDEESTRACEIRGLLDLVPGEPVPLDEVEPAHEIVTRFRTGAMSFGSLSKEAHETLAVAMNRLRARSNSGEGGEDPARYVPDENGDWRRSAIKQVASGRFGVTPEYLQNADELQIKIAQGAKPGEGGQLPGDKVDEVIARVRYATPGVGLISPPPHHDIYSIEDLAQLIHDLRNANDRAAISVKLVSEVGVGTVAAGVAKARADHILVSGHSGGTGASPLGSIKHAGLPWELGLAETQQVLVTNDLRGRVTLEVDGQLKTGRDVVVAALLGAERFGFGTAALIASGCILMRVCHLNTCPVGVATQDPELRRRFAGMPEHVISFFVFVAREVRETMARLGFRTMDEMIGRVDRLQVRPDLDRHWKARSLKLERLLFAPDAPPGAPRRCIADQPREIEGALDRALIAQARPALRDGERVEIAMPIRNVNRAVGTMLSAEVVRRHGGAGLPDRTLDLYFRGAAGQSFGAFLAPGLNLRLEGLANDALGKGMNGGRIAVFPPRRAGYRAEENVIIGNVALYGATGGEAYVRGLAGERFAVRNSGATAVVEGVGDHGCEYMTGGRVVVLGPTGRNFAAGMSGGVAFVLDADGRFAERCNREMVDLLAPDAGDLDELRDLILAHREATESPLAWRVLSGWTEQRTRFVKVMPRDYARALAAREEPRTEAKASLRRRRSCALEQKAV